MTVAAKTPSKKSTKAPVPKTTKKAATKPAPVVAAPVAAAPAAVENVEVPTPELVTIEGSMGSVLSSFSESILSLTVSLTKLKSDFKLLEKQVLKEARSMDKVNAKRNKNKGSRAPSGFVKPAGISKELAKFLGVKDDTMMARTDVTKLITQYVKDHKLQDVNNGRKILPDTKLKALLGVTAADEVTYFNLQKYMKPHFIKAVV
jgi:chromatin remodeling complex protein RSC6